MTNSWKGSRFRILPFVALLALTVPIFSVVAQEAPVAVHFVYHPPADGPTVTSVSLRGDFNNWGQTPMAKQPDGGFTVTVLLTPGKHQYKFFINGVWPKSMATGRDGGPVDPAADGYVADGYGGENAVRDVSAVAAGAIALGDGRIYTQALSFRPSDPADVTTSTSGTVFRLHTAAHDIERVDLQWRRRGQAEWTTVAMKRVGETLRGWVYAAKAATGSSVDLRFRLNDGSGPLYYGAGGGGATSTNPIAVRPFSVTLPVTGPPLIGWTQGTVAYQIFPDRFRDGNPANDPPNVSPWGAPLASNTSTQYYGGDLRGIIEELPYLHRLGVGLIYLNPIFEAGSSHRYDTIDYMKIDPLLGTLADFHELVARAHSLGIRIILDGVFNHTGTRFWAFQDIIRHGSASPYVDWYFIKSFPVSIAEGNYESWAGVASLPKLNVANPAVKSYLLSVVRYWTKQGIDGWRLDAANEITAPGFWAAFRRTVKAINPNAYLVGEIWQVQPKWLQGNRFDALMDYPIGYASLLPFFAREKGWTASRIAASIGSDLFAYSPSVDRMNFNLLDSHDTSRALTILGGGTVHATPDAISLRRMEAAVGVQFTLPGIPVIYYGDERGMTGAKGSYWDGERAPIDWSRIRVPSLLSYYERVSRLRRDHPALWSAPVKNLLIDNRDSVWAYQRSGDGHSIVVVTTNRDASFSVDLPGLPAGARYQDLITGETLTAGENGLKVLLAGPVTRIFSRR